MYGDESFDPVYYKILVGKDTKLEPICLQSLDEITGQYKPTDFLSDTKYGSEQEAQDVIDGIYRWFGLVMARVREPYPQSEKNS